MAMVMDTLGSVYGRMTFRHHQMLLSSSSHKRVSSQVFASNANQSYHHASAWHLLPIPVYVEAWMTSYELEALIVIYTLKTMSRSLYFIHQRPARIQ